MKFKIGDKVIINEIDVHSDHQHYKNGTEGIVCGFKEDLVRVLGSSGSVLISEEHLCLTPPRAPEPPREFKIGDTVFTGGDLKTDPYNKIIKNGELCEVVGIGYNPGTNKYDYVTIRNKDNICVHFIKEFLYLTPPRAHEPLTEFKIGDKYTIIKNEYIFCSGEEVEITALVNDGITGKIFIRNSNNIGGIINKSNLKPVKHLQHDQEVYVKMRFLDYDSAGNLDLGYMDYEDDNDDILVKPTHELFVRDSDGCLKKHN